MSATTAEPRPAVDGRLLDELAAGIVARMNVLPPALAAELRPGTAWRGNIDSLAHDSRANLIITLRVDGASNIEIEFTMYGGQRAAVFHLAAPPSL